MACRHSANGLGHPAAHSALGGEAPPGPASLAEPCKPESVFWVETSQNGWRDPRGTLGNVPRTKMKAMVPGKSQRRNSTFGQGDRAVGGCPQRCARWSHASPSDPVHEQLGRALACLARPVGPRHHTFAFPAMAALHRSAAPQRAEERQHLTDTDRGLVRQGAQQPDWNQLKALLETAQTGSLSAAARKLGLTQPALACALFQRPAGLVFSGATARAATSTSCAARAWALAR